MPELNKLGIVATVDRGILATYCDAWSKYVAARAELARGLVVKYRDDRGPTKNPAWQIYRDAAALVQALAREIGTSPAARMRMSLPEAEADDDGASLLD